MTAIKAFGTFVAMLIPTVVIAAAVAGGPTRINELERQSIIGGGCGGTCSSSSNQNCPDGTGQYCSCNAGSGSGSGMCDAGVTRCGAVNNHCHCSVNNGCN